MESRIARTITVLRKAFAAYRWQIIALVALGLVGGMLEGLGANILIPLFSHLASNQVVADDAISRFITGLLSRLPVRSSGTFLFVLVAALFVLRSAALILFSYLRIRMSIDYKNNTLRELLAQTFSAKWSYLLTQKLGHLQNIFVRDVHMGVDLFKMIGNFILAVTGLFMYFLVAVNISPQITFIALGLGASFLLFLHPLIKKTKSLAAVISRLEKQFSIFLSENLAGAKTVKAFASEDRVVEDGSRLFSSLRRLYIKNHLTLSLGGNILQPLSIIFILILFAYSFRRPGFNIASFVVTIYLIERMFTYIQSANSALQIINNHVPYVAQVIDFQEALNDHHEDNAGSKQFQFNQTLDFSEVDFSYTPPVPVLAGINFSVRKGETVGLIGPSGSGKTSVAELLLRLFNPTRGTILLDGVPAGEYDLRDWRRRIGYVSQDIFLLHDTVRRNIAFYDDTIADETIHAAARLSNCYDFITALPQGFDTVVGERGVLLSAGQRQRIVLARVLAQRPELLILDEATSALDNESERAIQQAITDLRGTVTVIMIAHRLTTVRGVDRLMVLTDGRIVEEGKPEILLRQPSSYFYRTYHAADRYEEPQKPG